ncbi:MAG: DJ-1 family glyoxalase III [Lachnospiraceae bacterium]|nr:DJ-1 family glyoxalase III [Lachnospiraceae bacterium]
MKKIGVFFANGFEEVEALTVVDLCRRGGIDVKMVAVSECLNVIGRSDIEIRTDILFNEKIIANFDGLILPGGMPGTNNLMEHRGLCKALCDFNSKGKLVAAICAAPMVLGKLGILRGKKACCYPGMEEYLEGAQIEDGLVSVDGNVITSRGIGTAIAFSLAIIEMLEDENTAEEVRKSIVYNF